MSTDRVSFSDLLLRRINELEGWLERNRGRRSLFPLRMAGLGLLVGLLLFSNAVAIGRWPIASLIRVLRPRGRAAGGVSIGADSDRPLSVDSLSLRMLLESGRPVLVDFWAEWCGPCIMMNEPLEALARELGDECLVAKVDTVKHPELAKAHGVRGLPTLVLFNRGTEADRHAGALGYPALEAFVRKHLA